MWKRNEGSMSNRYSSYGGNAVDDYDYDDYGAHTGDPLLDLEYEQYNEYMEIDALKNFIVSFYEALGKLNLADLSKLYEQTWPQLIDQYFKSSKLPGAKDISGLVGGNELVLSLYLELYYRHLHANVTEGP